MSSENFKPAGVFRLLLSKSMMFLRKMDRVKNKAFTTNFQVAKVEHCFLPV